MPTGIVSSTGKLLLAVTVGSFLTPLRGWFSNLSLGQMIFAVFQM
jgi:hypothetical protein